LDTTYWVLFLSTALLLNISPGPDMIYLVSQTMSHGKKVGFASVLGLGIGALVHTLFVSLGISIIISTSIVAFTIVKLIGAAYLFYLGIKALLFGGIDFSKNKRHEEKKSFVKALRNAILIDVTNPKVAMFFIAFLPQFYRSNGTSKLTQFMILGSIIVLVGFIVEGLIVLLADTIADTLRNKPLISKILDRVFGTVLIGLGVKLVFEKNN
jgi:threonine/homoserine/homoserine lactone efflux protein